MLQTIWSFKIYVPYHQDMTYFSSEILKICQIITLYISYEEKQDDWYEKPVQPIRLYLLNVTNNQGICVPLGYKIYKSFFFGFLFSTQQTFYIII